MGLLVGQNGFFMWWLVGFPQRIIVWGKNLMATVADVFAIKAMAQHLGDAIFQDPTWQGRLIGIAIRIGRMSIGVLAELLTFVFVGVVLVGWFMLPVIALMGIIK